MILSLSSSAIFATNAAITSPNPVVVSKAFEVRDPNLPYLGFPVYDSLRSDPRYHALLRRMNLPQ